MANLIWVGANQNNVGGKSCKAYLVRRQGKSVKISYGSIEMRGGGGGKIYWLGRYPRTTTKPLYSAKKAAEFVKQHINAKLAKGYRRLPAGVKFHKR